ncbi:hypothetical protein EG68_11592 [Paragonimus skrjabini miyazakii]|uniref:Uncharacterized protein n=1 Tax=Paragonimus skrjabini miyazakii TaxID=59628 RepID=A0A8S9YGV3_9TREM|nr:hypothetical protein EG68_11592 [Paragonimus skrjabini miyazakii]
MLIQQFIFGVRNEKIRESFLAEDASKLSWKKACEIAHFKEQVRLQCELFRKSPRSVSMIKNLKPSAAFQPLNKCFRCGSTARRSNSLEFSARIAECSSFAILLYALGTCTRKRCCYCARRTSYRRNSLCFTF